MVCLTFINGSSPRAARHLGKETSRRASSLRMPSNVCLVLSFVVPSFCGRPRGRNGWNLKWLKGWFVMIVIGCHRVSSNVWGHQRVAKMCCNWFDMANGCKWFGMAAFLVWTSCDKWNMLQMNPTNFPCDRLWKPNLTIDAFFHRLLFWTSVFAGPLHSDRGTNILGQAAFLQVPPFNDLERW